jgi:hypothetical protein
MKSTPELLRETIPYTNAMQNGINKWQKKRKKNTHLTLPKKKRK